MKFTGFASSCIGKALLIIFCIILGAVLSLGGLVLGIYVTLTKEGSMGTISDYAGKAGIEIQFDDDIKAMSVLGWVSEIMATVGDLSNKEIGSLERLLGSDLISKTIEDVIGVDAASISASTLDKLGETVSKNLTVANVQDKFGIEFPDMPLFTNEKFLSSPLSSAFGEFDQYTLGEILEINGDSNAVLQELKGVAIKDIGSSTTDDTIKSMLLCQLMNIDESSSKTLKALKYSCLESQYETDADGSIKILDGKKVYKKKTFTENGVRKTVELIGINETIETLCVKDVVDITDESAVVLRKMRKATEEEIAEGKGDMYGDKDLLVTELAGEEVTKIINTTKIGEIVDIKEDGEDKSEPILIALKDTSIENLNAKIKVLTLADIFSQEKLESGALSLIPADTTMDGIPDAMTSVMSTANTATLSKKGLIKEERLGNIGNLPKDQQAYIFNSNIGGMLEGLINFIENPIDATKLSVGADGVQWKKAVNYHYIQPDPGNVAEAEFSSLTDFVASYNQYETVTFDYDEVTVNIDKETDGAFLHDGVYMIPLFNIKNDDLKLNFVSGEEAVEVKAAVYVKSDDGYELSDKQYGFYYSESAEAELGKGFDSLTTDKDTKKTND